MQPGNQAKARRGFRTTHEVDSRYPNGRVRRRYVGRARRGAPSPAARDLLDTRVALAELTAAVEMLIRLDVNDSLTRAESVALHETIRGKVALAGRACDAVTLRSRASWGNRRAA